MARQCWCALILAGAISIPLGGCSKSDNSTQSGANPSANAPMQMNISSATPPVALGPDTIQGEIDKADASVKLVKLDLGSVGLPLTMEAPEGAKAERDPRAALLRELVDVQITAGEHFALHLRLGKRPYEEKRRQLAGQKALVNTKDLLLCESMLLLDARCEFVRHVVVGLHDYCVENIDPLFGQQVSHSRADCLLMLKCINTLAPKVPPPDHPLAALQLCNAAFDKNADGQIVNLRMEPRQTTDATLAVVAKLPALERLNLRRCPITDEGLKHLAGLTRLKELNLADCPITDAGLSSLSGLVNLETLNLASSFGDCPRIEGHGLAALAALTKLQVLVLDRNLVDDAGLSALKNLSGLKKVSLVLTKVTEAGAAKLKDAVPGVEVVLK